MNNQIDNKAIEEMAKIANGILLEVKPIKLRQKITKDVFEMLEQTRKETAKSILQEVRNLCNEQADRFSHLCKSQKEVREETCRYEGVLAVKNRLGKIAEKHGVEVE